MTDHSPPDAVREAPPSCSAVYQVLDRADRPLPTATIAERAGLPERTVRDALDRLRSAGVVDVEHLRGDLRRPRYHLARPVRE